MKTLTKGNIALCEGAIAAGCMAYFGYPITPQNEVPAHMSKRMTDLGRVFLQAESEIAAINMVLGASATGTRVMTSSSSPGISLKQEGISYIAACELPCLIVNVQRGGPGLGNISGAQGDYFQAVKGGGHGDYKLITLAPCSVQEMYDFAILAFDLAEIYKTPVMILSDGIVGQMMEAAEIPQNPKPRTRPNTDRSWILDGCKDRPARSIHSLLMEEFALEKHNIYLQEKYAKIAKNETRAEVGNIEDADIIVVGYGIIGRVAKAAANMARAKGLKIGFIRPITLWPFPSQIISKAAKPGRKFLVVEMNHGQMVEDVRLAVNGACPVEFYGKAGGGIITEEAILEKIKTL